MKMKQKHIVEIGALCVVVIIVVFLARAGTGTLRDAVESGDLNQVRHMVEAGADVNAKNAYGETALHRAATANLAPCDRPAVDEDTLAEIARFLLTHGALVDAKRTDGYTPLGMAAMYNNAKVAQVLIDAGANIGARFKNGQTVLHLVCPAAVDPETAAVLIKAGADVNARDNNGETPLHYAVIAGRTRLVALLLANGASADAVDNDGLTPLADAENAGDKNIAQLLRAYLHKRR